MNSPNVMIAVLLFIIPAPVVSVSRPFSLYSCCDLSGSLPDYPTVRIKALK